MKSKLEWARWVALVLLSATIISGCATNRSMTELEQFNYERSLTENPQKELYDKDGAWAALRGLLQTGANFLNR